MAYKEDNIIKVLFLASGDLLAGAEMVVYQLARGLNTYTDADISIILLNYGKLYELCMNSGINTVVLDERKYNFVSLSLMLSNVVRKLKPCIIHSHRYKENILAAFVSPLIGFPKLVTTVHGLSEVNNSMKSEFIYFTNKMFISKCFSRIIAVSNDLSNDLIEKQHIPKQKIASIYNGINLEDKKIGRPERNPNDPVIIGSAGRVVAVKDYDLLVDIAKEVCSKMNNVRFLLAGDGPEIGRIKAKVFDYGLGKDFQILGHVNDIENFMESLDIYINTSKHEGIPMTILEAMSHRLPVIAPDVGGIKEIIEHRKSGYIVPDRSVKSFAHALMMIINSEEISVKMGIHAYERVETRFSSRTMSLAYYDIYQEVLSKH